ncbi:hypothetical protein F2Q70_00033677 [Brassica cretica]|uniref:RNase H type-1 domain-containing protein n=1 Tax=Brassica cretica TaxID=69181 RepID=A0A8S9G5U1_BRACR|nr:hypothetical protein F2Q68_00028540 [Brassica cretica]KAF2586271.1 hypothetical protein F2Q70_00033677 [Brassica cretica]
MEYMDSKKQLVFNDKHLSANETLSKAIALAHAAWIESVSIAGLGWIVESQNRTSSYSAPAHHVKSPLAAEALALLEALVKCREFGLSRIRCESDSAVLIKAIKAESSLAEADKLAKQILSVELAFMASPTLV